MGKIVIDGIRKYYDLPESVSDEFIDKNLQGSMGAAFVRFGLAKNRLANTVNYKSILQFFKFTAIIAFWCVITFMIGKIASLWFGDPAIFWAGIVYFSITRKYLL